jgi:hypothetical protein
MLGGLIPIQWSWNSAWAIGTLVGLNLLTTGFSRLMLGIAARKPATGVAGYEKERFSPDSLSRPSFNKSRLFDL